MWFSFLPSVGRKQNHTEVSAGSQTVVPAGSKISRTVSAEEKYDGHSLQEAKNSGIVHTLCELTS